MENVYHAQICTFLEHGTLPATFSSTKANFIATANKFQLQENGVLTRNGKRCVLVDEKNKIFDALHSNDFYCQ